MNIKDLIGKTIQSATRMKLQNHDDEGFLRLEFSDGSACDIQASYGGYTGKSEDEYPTLIFIDDCDASLVIAENQD